MDAQLKAKWVKALRSGKYEQGQTYLENSGRYCCLGVLLKIQSASFPENLDDRCTAKIPKDFSGGLTAGEMSDLANRNDGSCDHHGKRYSFAEIADHIEANL